MSSLASFIILVLVFFILMILLIKVTTLQLAVALTVLVTYFLAINMLKIKFDLLSLIFVFIFTVGLLSVIDMILSLFGAAQSVQQNITEAGSTFTPIAIIMTLIVAIIVVWAEVALIRVLGAGKKIGDFLLHSPFLNQPEVRSELRSLRKSLQQ